jgi:hypothetical protein
VCLSKKLLRREFIMGEAQVSSESGPREVARPSDAVVGAPSVAARLNVAAVESDCRRSTEVLTRYAAAAAAQGVGSRPGPDGENYRGGYRAPYAPKMSLAERQSQQSSE